ncbi:MAG: M20 family metallopeptidase [Planctomycetaceae bacterium]|nr:M20 family metallopeptidase [Planctomycetaceae bacterium]
MTALDYARELVAFDSISLKSNCAVTDHVQQTLTKLGFETERLEYDDASGVRKASVVGKRGRGNGGMAYFGHTDVVPADDWKFTEHGPFQPTVKDGRLYGRGSCDMKGSVACALAAAERTSSAGLTRPLYIVCTADEEVGYLGAQQVAAESRLFTEMVQHGTRGVIGEPTRLNVVYAHKGVCGLVATSRGRAAHSSTREGKNANLAMIPYLAEMKAIYDDTEADPAWQHAEFDPPTVCWNIGINDHTRATNITPPQSICTIYFRVMPGQDANVLIERARRAAVANGLEFNVKINAQPLYIAPDAPFVREALELSGRDKPTTVSYGTDGAMLGALERMIVCGPGDIAQAHTNDEFISLEALDQGTALFERMIRRWCA